MLRVALSQLRTQYRRFVAVGLAVMLSVMFLSATLMVGASMNASLGASIGEAYRHADLVATPKEDSVAFSQAAADAAVSTPGLKESYAGRSTAVTFTAGDGVQTGRLRNAAPARLESAVLASGSMPSKDFEVAIDLRTAKNLGLTVGSVLELHGAGGAETATVTISGLTKAPEDPFSASLAGLVGSTPVLNALQPAGAGYDGLQFTLKSGEDLNAVKDDIAHRMKAAGAVGPVLETTQEKVLSTVRKLSGGQDVLTGVLLAFAGVAVLVSALVVANTFSVLVAQRTRELALLRCLGAGLAQIRGSVIAEALLVGLVSSVLGVLAATGLISGLISWAKAQPEQSFATLAVPPSAIIAGLVAGTLLTILAALVPAKAATAVAPLAALRPAENLSVRNKGGKTRLILGLAAVSGGAGLLVLSLNVSPDNALPVALLGGALSFAGILLTSMFYIPGVVAMAGRLTAPAGVPGKLATLNATRNPARTSATAAALLIGVTLVSMMMTGAATSKEAFNSSLQGKYPVDITAPAAKEQTTVTAQDAAQNLARIKKINGVDAAVSLQPVGALPETDPGISGESVYSIPAGEAATVIRDKNLHPVPGVLYLNKGSSTGPATIATAAGTVTLEAKVLRSELGAFVESSTITSGAFPQVPGKLWVKLDDAVTSDQIQRIQKEIATILSVDTNDVQGAAISRITFDAFIDVLLLVVSGLLGVAVVIALIGVANTLSLSVLERTQENSLLRALGLTKSQLRGMLAIEAALVAGVAAALGASLGILYGWLGAQSTLGGFVQVQVTPSVPWLQLLAVFSIAILAGLLASVIPAQRAARLSPVEGLATT